MGISPGVSFPFEVDYTVDDEWLYNNSSTYNCPQETARKHFQEFQISVFSPNTHYQSLGLVRDPS